MPRRRSVMPPKQRTFEFAESDVWPRLPEAVRDECRVWLIRQLKRALEHSQTPEENHEREDSRRAPGTNGVRLRATVQSLAGPRSSRRA